MLMELYMRVSGKRTLPNVVLTDKPQSQRSNSQELCQPCSWKMHSLCLQMQQTVCHLWYITESLFCCKGLMMSGNAAVQWVSKCFQPANKQRCKPCIMTESMLTPCISFKGDEALNVICRTASLHDQIVCPYEILDIWYKTVTLFTIPPDQSLCYQICHIS